MTNRTKTGRLAVCLFVPNPLTTGTRARTVALSNTACPLFARYSEETR